MPSVDLAVSRPWLASELNERSFRPPMSVTRPTLIFLPAGAAAVEVVPEAEAPAVEVVREAEAPDVEVELLSSEPQPAAAMRMPAAPMAAMARRVERARTCERTPSGIERDC